MALPDLDEQVPGARRAIRLAYAVAFAALAYGVVGMAIFWTASVTWLLEGDAWPALGFALFGTLPGIMALGAARTLHGLRRDRARVGFGLFVTATGCLLIGVPLTGSFLIGLYLAMSNPNVRVMAGAAWEWVALFGGAFPVTAVGLAALFVLAMHRGRFQALGRFDAQAAAGADVPVADNA